MPGAGSAFAIQTLVLFGFDDMKFRYVFIMVQICSSCVCAWWWKTPEDGFPRVRPEPALTLPNRFKSISSVKQLLASYKRRILEAEAQSSDEVPIIVYKAEAGYGNRFPGIISCLLLALMCDRVLIVNMPTNEPQFDQVFSPLLRWDSSQLGIDLSLYNLPSEPSELRRPQMLRDDMCNHFSEKAIYVSSLDYVVPQLYINVHHRAFIEKYFGAYGPYGSGVRQCCVH